MTFIEQVVLLTRQAVPTGMYYHKSVGPTVAHALTPQAYANQSGPATFVSTGEVTLTSEPAKLLELLYAGARPEDRKEFGPTLIRAIDTANARVVARTLAATGNVFFAGVISEINPVSREFWRGMIHVLRFESHLFTESDLTVVRQSIQPFLSKGYEAAKEASKKREDAGFGAAVVSYKDSKGETQYRLHVPEHDLVEEMESVIARIRYLRLAKTIGENQNPAIDADRQVLLSRLQSMEFSDKLVSASNDIEQRAVTAVTAVDVKSVMDLLRTFYEEFIEEACRKVEGKVGKTAPSGPSVNHFGPYRKYLEDHNFIGPEESELLNQLYRFLSNQGSHKLGSAPEQLRVAHATVIEWCMLIAGRVQKFMS